MRNVFITFLAMFMVVQADIPRTSLDRLTQFPYSGTILKSSVGDEFQVDFSGVPPQAEINIKFEITTPNELTSTFLAVDYNETRFKSGKLGTASFFGVNYTSVQENLDFAMLQLGKTQYIYRKKIGDRDNILYFTVYNLDPQQRCVDINYTIYIDIDVFPGIKMDCYPCMNSINRDKRRNSSSCICDRCLAGFYGPDCSVNMLPLTLGQSTSTVVDGPGMAFFMIQEINEVNILVKTSVGQAEIYFAFIDYEGEFASYVNVAQGKTSEGRFDVTAGTGGTGFTAVSSGSKMSLTVAVYKDVTTTIEVSYSVAQKSNVLLIVLAVLGSVLFVGLVIAGVYIYRNSSWFQNGRESRQIRPITQNLNDEEIQRFFPTILLKNLSLSHSAESSSIQLNESPSKPKIQIQDCVICLCPIEPQQSIKVTYCKHIFHAQCLIGWFKKQQNCPYCRQEFTRTNSIKLYKRVKESRGSGMIKGEDLVTAILSQQKGVIPSKDSVEMLQQKQTQKIKIGSRAQIQIQNLS